MPTIFIVAGVVGILVLLILIAINLYVVVDPNQAHVIVDHGGRRVFSPSTITLPDGTKKDYKTSYFFIPFLMRRIMVSLENVKHEINDIKLHDKEVAPFKCDITCWFKITNPELAAEKLDVDADGNIMESIKETLNAQVQGVARAAAMGQEVIELMRDRKQFSDDVQKSVNGDLDDWGVQLVKLEIIDFSDAEGSGVIGDYQERRQSEISSTTRQTVAEETKKAEVAEADAKRISQTAQITAMEEIEKRDITKQENVGVRSEAAKLRVAQQEEKANAQKVLADKKLTVGEATYKAQAAEIVADGVAKASIKTAEGQAKSIEVTAAANADAERVQGQAVADVVTAQGIADGSAIREKGTAEAVAVEKKAEAQKKFQDASKEVEFKKIDADVEKAKYASQAEAYKNADIQIVSDSMDFMGFDAKSGVGLGLALDNVKKTSGVNIAKAVKNVATVASEMLTKK